MPELRVGEVERARALLAGDAVLVYSNQIVSGSRHVLGIWFALAHASTTIARNAFMRMKKMTRMYSQYQMRVRKLSWALVPCIAL